jgi:hypothetical protein
MMESSIERLDDERLRHFDTEYVDDVRWRPFAHGIERYYPDGRFSFLDAGGGNGVFADRILTAYPESHGVVVDNSEFLLGRNQPHPRKTLLQESALHLERLVETKFDVVCFNWCLHHLVSRSYAESRRYITRALHSAHSLLFPRGHVSVYEDVYDGLVWDGAPSFIIHTLTSQKAIGGLIRRAGANTGGVGICFLSSKRWLATMQKAGHDVAEHTPGPDFSPVPWTWRSLLHVGRIHSDHFWLTPAGAVASGDGPSVSS